MLPYGKISVGLGSSSNILWFLVCPLGPKISEHGKHHTYIWTRSPSIVGDKLETYMCW